MNPIKRPRLLWTLGGLALASLFLAAGALLYRGQALASKPTPILLATAELEQALNEAPFVAIGGRYGSVWILAAPDDARKTDFRASLGALASAGSDVRVVLVAPRPEVRALSVPERRAAAALAQTRDWGELASWLEAPTPERAAFRAAALEPGGPEEEGYLEWGRATYDRLDALLRANKVDLRTPAFFWRGEGGWLVQTRPSPADMRDVARRLGR